MNAEIARRRRAHGRAHQPGAVGTIPAVLLHHYMKSNPDAQGLAAVEPRVDAAAAAFLCGEERLDLRRRVSCQGEVGFGPMPD